MNILLDQIKLNNKTYNEIFQKALTSIPILSKEWTDYNYSDPGITTLQVLSVLKLFQQSYVNRINDDVRRNLIKLLGYNIENVRPSLAYIKANSDFNFKLYRGARIKAGDIIFETFNNDNIIAGNLTNIIFYDSDKNKYFDKTSIMLDESDTTVYIFGKEPKVESAMYLVFSEPMEVNKQYNIYLEMRSDLQSKRRYIPSDVDFKLSEIDWEILTADGWHKINVQDNTKGFLQHGKIVFYIDKEMEERSIEEVGKGYVIRAVLKKSEYDLPPQIKNISINVIAARQKDTRAKSFIFDSSGEDKQEYLIENFITIYNNIFVLVKDENGRYKRCYDEEEGKEFKNKLACEIINNFDGSLRVIFDKKKYGAVPSEGKDKIKIICYNKSFFEKDIDKRIYGFENQIIKLELKGQIVSKEFNVMVKIKDYDGEEYIYDIDRETGKKPIIKYELDFIKNEIKILEVNTAGDIELIITDLVLSEGREGNVREGEINNFEQLLLENFKDQDDINEVSEKFIINQLKLSNQYKSVGGRDIETIDDVILKIMNDISSSHSLVTKKDFETKIFEVPGINVHKVKAICNNNINSVSIIIKPNSVDKFPVLTDIYRDTIRKYIEKYRLITTKLDILSPVYVPINVSGMIYIKPNYKDADKIIKNLIETELDGITTDKDFGLEIVYGDLYSKIENLSCVDVIYYLSLDHESPYATKNINSNIILDENALSYLGSYNIELSNNIMMVM